MSTNQKPEPFSGLQEFAKKIMSVPKKEIDRREEKYKETRASLLEKKDSASPQS